MTTHWSLGVLVGLPIAGVLVLICLAIIALGLWMAITDDIGDGVTFSLFGVIFLLAVLVTTGGALWPWDARFHQWRPVIGTVEQTNSRLISDGKTVSQRIVVSIDGKPYGCDDTRCTLLQKGDQVALTCKPEYQWAGVSGEACEFVGSSRTGDLPK